MPEPLPSSPPPPAPPAAPQPAGAPSPGIVQAFVAVLSRPAAFYASLHLADRRRTFAACAALGVLVGLLGAAGYVGERAARDRGDMEDRFGEGSEFQREMRRAQEELRRAADDARARKEGGR